MKNSLLKAIALVLVSTCSFSLIAHERFILPSHTQLSGEKAQAVSFISSISNDIFHPDRPFGDSNTGIEVGRLKKLFDILEHTVIDPNGKVTTDTRWQAFERFSVADVQISEAGTYRVGLVQPEVFMTTFKKADGTPRRIFGKDATLPENATDIVRRATTSRVETFVTYNSPNDQAIKPTGKGLELGGSTHPNDLFTGETANFQLFLNGKLLKAPSTLKVIKAGTRHRNNRNEVKLTADETGRFSFTPESAGFYFLTAESKVDVVQPADVDVKNFSLHVTLEVFAE